MKQPCPPPPTPPYSPLLCMLFRCAHAHLVIHIRRIHSSTRTNMFTHTYTRGSSYADTHIKKLKKHMHSLKCPLWPTSLCFHSPFTASKSLFHLPAGLGLWVTGNRMDLMLSLSQRCGLEGGLALQSAPGGVLGGWGGVGGRLWTWGGGVGWSDADLQGQKHKLGYSLKFT